MQEDVTTDRPECCEVCSYGPRPPAPLCSKECVCVLGGWRERDREKDRQTDRQTDRDTETETERQRDREIGRQRHRE